jgi:hypothetical protein
MEYVPFVLATMAPGLVLIAAGIVLIVRGRPGRPSIEAGRLFYLGFALVMLVPGVGIAANVVTGALLAPALLGAVVPILFGGGVLYGLRLHWNDPWRGSATGD